MLSLNWIEWYVMMRCQRTFKELNSLAQDEEIVPSCQGYYYWSYFCFLCPRQWMLKFLTNSIYIYTPNKFYVNVKIYIPKLAAPKFPSLFLFILFQFCFWSPYEKNTLKWYPDNKVKKSQNEVNWALLSMANFSGK